MPDSSAAGASSASAVVALTASAPAPTAPPSLTRSRRVRFVLIPSSLRLGSPKPRSGVRRANATASSGTALRCVRASTARIPSPVASLPLGRGRPASMRRTFQVHSVGSGVRGRKVRQPRSVGSQSGAVTVRSGPARVRPPDTRAPPGEHRRPGAPSRFACRPCGGHAGRPTAGANPLGLDHLERQGRLERRDHAVGRAGAHGHAVVARLVERGR